MEEARRIYRSQRFRILNRDSFTCQYCGRAAPEVVLEVDHRLPVAFGGGNTDDNLVTACRDCNQGKGTIEIIADPERDYVKLRAMKPLTPEQAEALAQVPFGTHTEEEVRAAMTVAGSWTHATLRGWGVPIVNGGPPRGWKDRLLGLA